MAIDQGLADRLRKALTGQHVTYEEKKMFGGLAFMVNQHMTIGITNKNELMVRCRKEDYNALLTQPGARQMLFTGKPMSGFLFVDLESVDSDDALDLWVKVGLDFSLSAPPKRKK